MRIRNYIGLFFLLVSPSPAALAGLIEVSFTADVELSTGGPVEQASGSFILDTDAPFPYGTNFNPDVVVGGSFTSGAVSGEVVPDSAFNLASSGVANEPYIQLVGDYGPQIFALELTSDLFVNVASAFDLLTPDLTLDDMLPYDPDPSVLITTRFVYFTNDPFEIIWGPLTSFSVSEVLAAPEPGTLWLVGIAAIVLVPWRRIRSDEMRDRRPAESGKRLTLLRTFR